MRGVAALLIVAFHYTVAYNDNSFTTSDLRADWGWRMPWGFAAVVTFFMLSGFLSARWLLASKRPAAFVWKKLKRFYPAYWVCMTLSCVVLYGWFREASVGFWEWAANLTMVSQLLRVPFVDGVYWTMQCELVFMLFMAVLIPIRRVRTLRWTLALWVGAAIALGLAADVRALRLPRMVLCSQYCQYFVAGIALWRIGRLGWRAALPEVGILVLCGICAVVQNSPAFTYLGFFGVTAVALLGAERMDRVLDWRNPLVRVLGWVASVSYPLYLFHEMAGFAVIRHMRAAGWAHPLALLLPVALSLGVAWAVHMLVERRIK